MTRYWGGGQARWCPRPRVSNITTADLARADWSKGPLTNALSDPQWTVLLRRVSLMLLQAVANDPQ